MEKIEVVYREIGPKIYHKYIVYTDNEGNQYAASGWPQNKKSGPPQNEWDDWLDHDYGNIITTHGKYDSIYPDHPGYPGLPKQSRNYEEIITGNDLSSDWEKITESMDDIANEGHQYRVPFHNSNSTVDEALRRAGLPEPQNDGPHENWAPGYGNNLPGGPDHYRETPNPNGPFPEDLWHGADPEAQGLAEQTGWVGKDDGLLVRDLDGDGQITSGRELFGNHTRLNNGKAAANGFEALKELDDNTDGVIDSKDAAFSSLKVWKDADGDGVTDDGELLSLNEAGVQSLKVAHTDHGSSADPDAQGNQHRQLGSFTTLDGETRDMNDVWFAVDSARTVDREQLAVSDEIAALPNVSGLGNLRSLHQAMARDDTGQLQALVKQYADPGITFAQRDALLNNLLYHWAGGQDVKKSISRMTWR